MAHLARHALPHVGIIMGAIDAGNVHAQRDQVLDQRIIIGGLSRKGHHDAGHPPGGTGAEQCVSVVIEGTAALFEGLDCRPKRRCRSVERCPNTLDRGQNVRFASAQRPKTAFAQPTLEMTHVSVSECEIMHQVGCVTKVGRVNSQNVMFVLPLHPAHQGFQGAELGND